MDDDKTLIFTVKKNKRYDELNRENIEAVQQAMRAAGIMMELYDDGTLYIRVREKDYRKKMTRNAGRYKKSVYNSEFCTWRYSDIVCMLQTMTDKQIYTSIGMASATYYRHKKELLQSEYYASLDTTRLEDMEYLQSLPKNHAF